MSKLKETFRLVPDELSDGEKIAIEKTKGNIISIKKKGKQVIIPTKLIRAHTSGKQKSLFGTQIGETLEMFE